MTEDTIQVDIEKIIATETMAESQFQEEITIQTKAIVETVSATNIQEVITITNIIIQETIITTGTITIQEATTTQTEEIM